MEAIILAGGLGTRLRSVVNDRPKPMALINGKPFLQYLVERLRDNGIRDIIFAVGYKGSMVEEYFKDGSSMSVQIKYSYEDGQLGTAGAIKNAESLIKEDEFIVLNGDTFYMFDYSRLFELNKNRGYLMSLVLREVDDISRYGKAGYDNDRLTSFNEKVTEHVKGTINGGIYCMNKEILKYIPDGKVSLENEIIPKLMSSDIQIGAIVNDGYFIDIGIPEDYFRFEKEVVNLKENY